MNIEHNKLLAAVLIAGIAAYSFGFASDKIYKQKFPEKNAYYIEVPEGGVTTSVAAAPKTAEPITAEMMAAADVSKGQKLSRACAACHTFNAGGANGIGPNLHNIYNAAKGGKAGFAYSDAMKSYGGQWGVDELNGFLWKPKTYMPGTKMNYIGLKKPEDRAAMIAWLKTLK